MTLLVVARLVRALAFVLAAALLLAPKLASYRWSRDRERWLRALGDRAAWLCERCGPAMIKMAQIAASRRDLLPPHFADALSRVQDHVRAPSGGSIMRALRGAYGPPSEWPFELLSLDPIAAGSVAVVLRARSRRGDLLAVKLVRTGVKRGIAADLNVARWIAGLLQRHRLFAAIPLVEAFEQLRPMIARQCDMIEEAKTRARLAPSVTAEICLPATYPELTRSAALVMDLCPAVYRINDPALDGANYRRGARALLHALYRMIFVNGYVHCDLHPGNVGYSADGRVILYDFGLCTELSEHDRFSLAELFAAVVDPDAARAASILLHIGRSDQRKLNHQGLIDDMAQFLCRWSGLCAGQFLIAGFVRELFELQHRHGISGSPGFAAAIAALATFEGLVRDRYSELEFQLEARPFLVSHLLVTLRR